LMEEEIEARLGEVVDPVHEDDIVSMGLVESVSVNEEDDDEGEDDGSKGVAEVRLNFGAPYAPDETAMAEEVRDAVEDAGYEADLTSVSEGKDGLPDIKNVILVASGKGGVGKTTVASNLAVGLDELGASVGLLDSDVYGPNAPSIMGVKDDDIDLAQDQKIIPPESDGVPVVSMDYMVPDGEAAIFRGPMVNKYVRQFFGSVDWGKLDYLVVDLPPGTGDVPLGITRSIDVDGSVVVTTPQHVATDDTGRNIQMFREKDVPLLGVVENMSGFRCSCGSEHKLFGGGGGTELAMKYDTHLLGEIPMQEGVGDEGTEPVARDGRNVVGRLFRDTAAAVANRVGTENRRRVMEDEKFSLPMV